MILLAHFKIPFVSLAFLSLITLTGCTPHPAAKINYSGELPPGQVGLRKISLAEYPDFTKSTWNLNILGPAVEHSISYLQKPSSARGFPYLDISHDRALATCLAFRDIIAQARTKGGDAAAGAYISQQIIQNFEVYKSVGAPDPDSGEFTERVLFTAYCTPIYDASLTRQGEYIWPVYKRPPGLVVDQQTGEPAKPFQTRQQIESGGMAGLELAWFKSRWEAYKVTIQGSARLRLTDGKIWDIGYAGNNGYEYTSPGMAMVNDHVIAKSELNGTALGSIFQQQPALMDKYLWMNQRTEFLVDRPGGPFGALNEVVTPYATIATDKTIDKVSGMTVYPRGMPAFLDVPMTTAASPDQPWQFHGFMMDQDTGGAIRAAGRTDIYMGIGPEAENVASHQLFDGQLYYVALKPELVPRYAPRGTTASAAGR